MRAAQMGMLDIRSTCEEDAPVRSLTVEAPDQRLKKTAILKSRFLHFLVAQVSLCLVLLWIWPHLGIDDSYIFLTYARNLKASGLFAFNPGEVTYGFSSPAYVMLLAAASRLSGIPVGPALSNLLGVLLCGLSACAIWSLWGEINGQPSDREMPLTAVLLSGPWFFTIWFVFGMETGLAVLSLLGFLLWLAKLRAGAPRFPWLLVGILATSIFAITRLESGIFIACGIIFALATSRSRSEIRDLTTVALLSGGVETAWLLYAKHTFGTYLPWTSTARLLYYMPGSLGLASAAQFYQLGVVGRSIVALKAVAQMFFAGPLKFLLVFVPLLAAAFYLRTQRSGARMKWMLWVATLGMALQIIAFAYLFPLAENRHFAPYIAGIWVIVSAAIARDIHRMGRFAHAAAITAVMVLWIGGAVRYRTGGMLLEPLHRLAASGYLLPTDKVAAEPIGIISFETHSYIIDLGGLTDRTAWPMLMQAKHEQLSNVIAWDSDKGATKVLFPADDCGIHGRIFGTNCLMGASDAKILALHDGSLAMTAPTSAPATTTMTLHAVEAKPVSK
jgi:hypothetical protein